MTRCRWESPFGWLSETANEWDAARLYNELMSLAARLDGDALQDEYQADMDAAGYFNEEGAE